MYTKELTKYSASTDVEQTSRILVVEDEQLIQEMLAVTLSEEGYKVDTASDGRSAFDYLNRLQSNSQQIVLDLIVLDVMLPHINGLDICRLLRHQANSVPILMLSAKGSETDRVLGLEVGADDYLTKPFSMHELVARCRSLLRRQRLNTPQQTQVLKYKDITLNQKECCVWVRGQQVNLSPKEFRLLELFMSHVGQVLSREQLLDRVWGLDYIGDSRTVDVYIRWLREKLELDPKHPEYLITLRGFGYRLG
ncbi:response regulator transcription factor [Nostoc sp. MG11]|uniref:response regulator transcription factor n=1 Tax=Nostoc sp. MG11 TaxID=2721166 RepID=UPI0018679A92|nr:response regulator transcription factor [Nostoc sp. MG11]